MFLKHPVSYIYAVLLGLFGLVLSVPVFAAVPSVTTYAPTKVSANCVELRGYASVGSEKNTRRWFEWGDDSYHAAYATRYIKNENGSDNFSEVLARQKTNTVLYYRAVAENSSGRTYGNEVSFQTQGEARCADAPNANISPVNTAPATNINTSANTGGYLSVTTRPATNIVDTGAILNALAVSANPAQTYGWFEWGSTPNLGYTSVRRYLGAGNPLSLGEALSGLTPGTTYFFKPVIENQNGRFEGVLFSFHTTGMTPVPTAQNSASAINSVAPKAQSVSKKTEPKPAIVSAPNSQKMIKIEVVPSVDVAAPKERVSETIHIENTTNTTLKEVAVRVVLPCNVVYVSSGGDEWIQTGTMLTHKVGAMKPKEKLSLLFRVDVGSGVADKTPVEMIAVVDWADPSHSGNSESVGRSTITVDVDKVAKDGVAAAAAVKDTNSIFPQNLRDWAAIIGFLFLLFAAYMVFLVMRKKEDIPEEDVLETTLTGGNTPHVSPGRVSLQNNADPFITNTDIYNGKTVIPVISIKKAVTEKGAPPDNLPI